MHDFLAAVGVLYRQVERRRVLGRRVLGRQLLRPPLLIGEVLERLAQVAGRTAGPFVVNRSMIPVVV